MKKDKTASGEDPYFPIYGMSCDQNGHLTSMQTFANGISKREFFAAVIAQGMMAGSQGMKITPKEFAESSVALADILLVELEKTA